MWWWEEVGGGRVAGGRHGRRPGCSSGISAELISGWQRQLVVGKKPGERDSRESYLICSKAATTEMVQHLLI